MKAIDLFAGAGGFTLSALNAEVNVVAAVEFDHAAAKTYRRYFNVEKKQNIKLHEGDINELDPAKLRESLGLEVGELDMILGGPPCQGFSTHRINNAGVNDPRNQLLLRYFEFVHEFKPKFFLVENVSGLLWKWHEEYLKKFISLAEDKENYDIRYCNVLNAKDYGVPQNRKRVFILGVRRDINLTDGIFPPPPTCFSERSKDKPKWKNASTVFEKMPSEVRERFVDEFFIGKKNLSREEAHALVDSLEYGEALREDDPLNRHMQPTPKMEQRFKDTPLNGSRIDAGKKHELECHSGNYKGHKDVYGRMFIHQPSNTMTTGCNNPSKGRYLHPWKNHGITLRHAARLQTFPDDFNFEGSTTEIAKQIGNAVPPLLGEALIKSICSRLN